MDDAPVWANGWARTDLVEAARTGNLPVLRAFVAPEDVDYQLTSGSRLVGGGETVLYLAASTGRVECVQWLLSLKANVRLCDNEGWTPLHAGITSGSLEVVQLLLSANASESTAGKAASLLLKLQRVRGHADIARCLLQQRAAVNALDGARRTPLVNACEMGSQDTVDVLIEAGADMHPGALCAAAKSGHLDVMRSLLAMKASVLARDSEGYTALHFAIKAGRVEAFQLLLQCKADVGVRHAHCTALHLAVTARPDARRAMVNALALGESALEMAALRRDRDTAWLLLLCGASLQGLQRFPELRDELQPAAACFRVVLVLLGLKRFQRTAVMRYNSMDEIRLICKYVWSSKPAFAATPAPDVAEPKPYSVCILV